MINEAQAAGEIAKNIDSYGSTAVTLGIFLILFLGVVLYLIETNKKYMETMIKQNNDLITKLIQSNKNREENASNKNLIPTFMKINTALKNECKEILTLIEADRTAIYAFHNGTSGVGGSHFLKISCISEYLARGAGVPSRMTEHTNLPISLLDSTIEELLLNGNCILEFDKDDEEDSNQIIKKLLLTNCNKACILYVIYEMSESSPIGFVLSEFDINNISIDEVKAKRKYLKCLAEKISPILEINNYYKFNGPKQ